MRFLSSLVFCFLCYSLSLASDTYRAATFGSSVFSDLRRYLPALKDASKHDVNIVVLPSGDIYTAENYDEDVKTLSDLAQQTNLYIVAHLLEKTQCPNGEEVVRSNLVFDKEGSIIAVYRKPMNNIANCTFTSKDVTTFTSDFGVTFGLLMEEDLVLRPPGLKGLKNFVVTGPSQADISFLNANQFAPSWAFINNVNLITSSAVYAGRSGKVEGQYVDLMKFIEKESNEAPLSSLSSSFTSDDITGFIIRPVDLNLSPGGYEETVCHESFCCQFYVKTKAGLKQPKMNYYLSTFSGIRSFDKSHDIGTQICSVFACHQLEKRSCSLGSEINSTVAFEKISISSNFTTTVNYPIILTSDESKLFKKFAFHTKPANKTTLAIENGENLLRITIYGRDFSKDNQKYHVDFKDTINMNVYDYIFNEDVIEFFDYVWIRLRILIIVVSIYVLEMM